VDFAANQTPIDESFIDGITGENVRQYAKNKGEP
jgi:hypothetical protein